MHTTVSLHRWDELALEKVTEMISRKIVTGEREMLAQIYLKKGALVPMHAHESEQMTYVLQGALKFLIGGEEITVREGEVLHIPSWVEHQAEALDDTFELDVFSPIRQDWLDHTDAYFQTGRSSRRRDDEPGCGAEPHVRSVHAPIPVGAPARIDVELPAQPVHLPFQVAVLDFRRETAA